MITTKSGPGAMLQRSGWSGFAAGAGLGRGLKIGDNFLAITSIACAILERSSRSFFTLLFVMVLDSRAGEKRLLMGRMNAQADAIEENMKRVAQEESGDYCECEKGHRKDGASTSSICL